MSEEKLVTRPDLHKTEEGPRDTQRPESNGFLEQFESLTFSNLLELTEVCKAGLIPEERMILIRVSIQLLSLAADGSTDEDFESHPEFKTELEVLLTNLSKSIP